MDSNSSSPRFNATLGKHLWTNLEFQEFWLKVSVNFQQRHASYMLLDLYTLMWTKLYQKIK